jgi:DNA repair photolyase
MQVTTYPAKSLLNKATGFIKSYDFTLNPYRGCQFGCNYCYASAFSPNQQMRKDWGNWVVIKENASQLLDKELSKITQDSQEKISIYMSSVTDPYQPIEKETQLTRNILMILLKYQPILVLQTRSPMIIRDSDILGDFQNLRINMSIPTASERVKKDFERRSPSVKSRLKTIEKLKYLLPFTDDRNIRFSVTMTPLLPSYPEDLTNFIRRLEIFDRVVIQPFHSSQRKSLAASTPQTAIDLKQKYEWWYGNEKNNYENLRGKLESLTHSGVEILEGQEGFNFD